MRSSAEIRLKSLQLVGDAFGLRLLPRERRGRVEHLDAPRVVIA